MSWRNLIRDELRDLRAYETVREPVQVKLDANESPFPLPPELAEALGRLLAGVPVHRYPDPTCAELRGVFARLLGVAPDQLVFGNGSDEFLALLVAAFGKPRRGEARARVAYPVPTFSMFRAATLAGGALPLEIPLRDDFSLDPLALDRQVTGGKPNLVLLARPNNPTGTVWERDAIEAFVTRHPDIAVVVDEAYAEYAGETMIDAVARHANLVVTRSMSKVGLAGLRLGVLVAQAEVARELDKVRMPFNVNALTQRAAAFLIGQHHERLRERHEALIAERERVFAALGAQAGVTAFPSRANFVLFRVADAEGVWRGLLKHGVLVRNLSTGAGLRGCLRVTIGTHEENDAFLRALGETLAEGAPAQAAAPATDEPDRERQYEDEEK